MACFVVLIWTSRAGYAGLLLGSVRCVEGRAAARGRCWESGEGGEGSLLGGVTVGSLPMAARGRSCAGSLAVVWLQKKRGSPLTGTSEASGQSTIGSHVCGAATARHG